MRLFILAPSEGFPLQEHVGVNYLIPAFQPHCVPAVFSVPCVISSNRVPFTFTLPDSILDGGPLRTKYPSQSGLSLFRVGGGEAIEWHHLPVHHRRSRWLQRAVSEEESVTDNEWVAAVRACV